MPTTGTIEPKNPPTANPTKGLGTLGYSPFVLGFLALLMQAQLLHPCICPLYLDF
ncbi:hypothetical protein HBZS_105850 [Helicobacter bizzozeronii CCUG 35545]|nr:hypothetical protein HBZS_105850 [Helicobacter bizzozeronii CCUG 35545]